MQCHMCGAAMKLASSRDHFVCEYCGAHAFPTRSNDGVELLGEVTSYLCPLCSTPMIAGRLEGAEVEHCTRCEGFFIAQAHFGAALAIRRAWAEKREPPPWKPIDPGSLARRINCPHCGKTMYAEPYLGPGNVVLDTCLSCERMWLDRGEMSALVRA